MKLHPWIPALAATLLFGACSATQARIDDNEDLFNAYPPEVQAMIKSNRIDQGFDSTQVYLAFGNADRTEMDGAQELWYYHKTHNRTVQEEKTASEYRQEMSDYEDALEQGKGAVQEPKTYRVIRLHRTGVYRIVRFETGHVVGWEEPEEMWLEDWHE